MSDDPEEYAARSTTEEKWRNYQQQRAVRKQVLLDSLANFWIIFSAVSLFVGQRAGGITGLLLALATVPHTFVVGLFARGAVPDWVFHSAVGGTVLLGGLWAAAFYVGSPLASALPFSSFFFAMAVVTRFAIEKTAK